MLWGKHKTRDNTNEIEMRDNNNFHRIIFQVFEQCLSEHCIFSLWLFHCYLTHSHSIFTRMMFVYTKIYTITEHAAVHSAVFFSSSSPFSSPWSPSCFLFQSNQRSVTLWNVVLMYIDIGVSGSANRYTPLFYQQTQYHPHNVRSNVWNHIALSYYVSGCSIYLSIYLSIHI